MSEFLRLVYNEMEKVYRKKRLVVVILILLVLIPMFVYGQYRQTETIREKLGTDDWRISLQQRIVDSQNRLNSSGLPDEYKKFIKIQVQQQQYYLDHDINPTSIGAPTFLREFIQKSTSIFLPLLVMIIAIDIVSGERSDGTIKLLLTRPVKRWKVLLSKYVTMLLSTSIIVLLVGILSYLISGLVLGYSGWNLPVVSGFAIHNGNLDTALVHLIPQWKYIIMAAGFAWYVSIIVGTISFMISVLIRNTPAGMGIMLAALIAGNILQGFAGSWEGAKYIFSVNLQLTDYLAGQIPAVEGLTLNFSIINLAVWGIVSLFISFFVFTRQDMLS